MASVKIASLSVFLAQIQTPLNATTIPCQQFMTSPLFDRNLVKLVQEFLSFPLLPRWSLSLKVPRFYYVLSFAFHPITGNLWIALDSTIMVYKINKKDSQCIDTIDCPGRVDRICIGRGGLVLIVHDTSSVCFLDDSKKSFTSFFDTRYSFWVCDVAINDTNQQIAIATTQGNIFLYSFNWKILCVLKGIPSYRRPESICWNEKESMLYIIDDHAYLFIILDTKNDRVINTFEIVSDGKIKNNLQMVSRGYIEDEQKMIVACHDQVFIINTKNFSIEEIAVDISSALKREFPDPSSTCDFIFARRHNDIHNQLFVLGRPLQTEVVIDTFQLK